MTTERKKNKKAFWGYGVAGFGDSTYYSIIGSFLLFFLTSVAHVPNVAAGFISSLGSISDGIWSPVMGSYRITVIQQREDEDRLCLEGP